MKAIQNVVRFTKNFFMKIMYLFRNHEKAIRLKKRTQAALRANRKDN